MRVKIVYILLLSSLALNNLNAQNGSAIVRSMIDSARVYQKKEPKKTLFFGKQVLKIAKPADLWSRSKIYSVMGRAYEHLSKDDSALINYRLGLQYLDMSDTTDYFSGYYMTRNTASILNSYQLYDLAITNYDSALSYLRLHIETYPKVAKKYNDLKRVHEVTLYLASNKGANGDIQESFSLLRTITQDSTASSQIRFRSGLEIGWLFMEAEMYDSAISEFSRIVKDSISQTRVRGMAYHSLAGVNFRKGVYHRSIALLDSAIELKKQVKNNKRSLFLSYMDKGEALMMIERNNDAYQFLLKALDLDVDVSRSEDLYKVYYFLSDVSRELGRHRESKKWSSLYRQTNLKSISSVHELDLRYRQRAIMASILAHENQTQSVEEIGKLEKRNRSNLKWLIGLAFFVLSALAAYIYYRKKKAQKLENEVSSAVAGLVTDKDLEQIAKELEGNA